MSRRSSPTCAGPLPPSSLPRSPTTERYLVHMLSAESAPARANFPNLWRPRSGNSFADLWRTIPNGWVNHSSGNCKVCGQPAGGAIESCIASTMTQSPSSWCASDIDVMWIDHADRVRSSFASTGFPRKASARNRTVVI